MGINTIITKNLNGASGGVIDSLEDYKGIQIAISGRTAGILTVTAKSFGGELAETVENGTIDLGAGQFTIGISGFSIESLTIIPDVAGDPFTVTLTQWPH